MSSAIHPLHLPGELEKEIRAAAKESNLSMADVMRQSIKIGLPKFREHFKLSNSGLKPFTRAEARECWGKADPEFDALAAHCAALPAPDPEGD